MPKNPETQHYMMGSDNAAIGESEHPRHGSSGLVVRQFIPLAQTSTVLALFCMLRELMCARHMTGGRRHYRAFCFCKKQCWLCVKLIETEEFRMGRLTS